MKNKVERGIQLGKELCTGRRGLVPVTLAESFYEKGRENYTVLSQISKSQTEVEGGGKIELLFVSVGLQVRCYLHMGKNIQALVLLERLRHYADISKRTYIRMETNLLTAITRQRLGEEWKEPLLMALKEASEYHFARIISEEGAAIFPLLKKIKNEYIEIKDADTEW